MKNKTIKSFVWFTTLKFFIGFIVIVLLLNLTVFNSFKNDFIYDQLRNEADFKLDHREMDFERNDILHFVVLESNGKYIVGSDGPTKSAYKDNGDLLETIANDVDGQDQYFGKTSNLEGKHYYYSVKLSSNETMIFIKSVYLDWTNLITFALLSLSLLILTYFISLYIAKKVEEPIKDLKDFSSEISKKNWEAQGPNLDILEFHELSDTLTMTKESLKTADERDKEFLQSTSHDLKTPVMVIKGYAQSMIDGVSSLENVPDIILSEANRLESKIHKLLNLNTLDYQLKNKENWSSIALDRMMNHLVNKFKIINPDINWLVNIEAMELLGDSDALLIAFENIIENQIRYAKDTIEILMTPQQIIISNNGPQFEIEPDLIFERYYKNSSGQHGLGLSITKKVLDAHGMTIHANNTEHGVAFKIEL